ncbi:MAG: AAA family ATPase [Acidimicrobiales bacterium]
MTAPETTPEYPPAPSTIQELGIPEIVVEDLILQRLTLDGRSSVTRMAAATALSVSIIDGAVDKLRQRLLLEIQGMDGRDYILAPTDKGKAEAASRAQACSYAGAAPVSLQAYTIVVDAQKGRSPVTPDTLAEAFNDLIIAPGFFDDLGPALVSQGAVFLYGPPGTGKTSLAERLVKLYGDPILVPRAVEVETSIVTVFDPAIHEPVAPQPAGLDPRWVQCARPCVIVGGELTSKQLELERDASSGVYRAPLQMKANNGIFVIDDFGRQKMTPEALLNRWIVPLSRSIDFLTLAHGGAFTIPFDAKVVFSTNMRPDQLGDDAFARRIPNKVFVGSIDDAAFDQILAAVCKGMSIGCNQESANYLRTLIREVTGTELRPYYPADFAKTLVAICEYEGRPKVLDRNAIDRVANIYFTKNDDAGTWETQAAVAA